MIKLIVNFYNHIICNNYYSERQLKIVNIILEKGKELVLGKLHIIQLIEADLQLLICIFMRKRAQNNIEKDKRISEYNYVSRKGYSIKLAILEKWFISHYTKRVEE